MTEEEKLELEREVSRNLDRINDLRDEIVKLRFRNDEIRDLILILSD